MSRMRLKAGTKATGVRVGTAQPPVGPCRKKAAAQVATAKPIRTSRARLRKWAPIMAAAALAVAGSGCSRSVAKTGSGRPAEKESARPVVQAASSTGRYLPEYLPNGDLVLPKNFHSWVFVGAPLTPNALNNGKANFPEFHNVYIEPGSYAIYKRTGVFPEGTIFFKELQLTLPPAEFPDGSRMEP
jgi:hypothetical protein